MGYEDDAQWMVDRLADRFGVPPDEAEDPVETLVLTILSQNTTDVNRDRAYATLRERFPDLVKLADAPEAQIADAIRPAGLQTQKAHAIRVALRRILAERGTLDLAFLRTTSQDAALAWLLDLPGVGHKTAGIVLLFSFGIPYFPVDTHIRRVLTRIGWLRNGEDPHRRANEILPRDASTMRALHLQWIRLGRTLCRPRTPRCDECPIDARCTYGGGRSA